MFTCIEELCGATAFELEGKKGLVTQDIGIIDQLTVSIVELLSGKIFDETGFSQIPDDLICKLVHAGLRYPERKLKNTTYLAR